MRLSSYALIDLRQRERVIDWLSQWSKHNKLFVSEGPIKPHVTKIEESKNIRENILPFSRPTYNNMESVFHAYIFRLR